MSNEDVIKEGDPAPDFSLMDQDENTVSLVDLKGKWTVLYFYPKDNTSGCTAEAKDFTSMLGDFESMGARIVGVSPDSCSSHANFIRKHDLKLQLISDPDHDALSGYDTWKLKKMYGREYHGVERSTFLIDPDGIVRKIWRKVKVNGHADEVKSALSDLIGKDA
ncbi:MAG: peroxiredoxin [Thermoplasmatota archaeon]